VELCRGCAGGATPDRMSPEAGCWAVVKKDREELRSASLFVQSLEVYFQLLTRIAWSHRKQFGKMFL
jgi:hypothetical protein